MKKILAVMALVGMIVLLGAVGSIETESEFVIPWVKILVGFGLMMPLFIKYFWREYVA